MQIQVDWSGDQSLLKIFWINALRFDLNKLSDSSQQAQLDMEKYLPGADPWKHR